MIIIKTQITYCCQDLQDAVIDGYIHQEVDKTSTRVWLSLKHLKHFGYRHLSHCPFCGIALWHN